MRRFYAPPELLAADDFLLPAEILHHVRVLRLKEGSRIELFDGRGGCAVARLAAATPGEIRVAIESRRQDPAPPFRLHLLQGIPKGSKMDLLLQKGTELGICRFSPVYCRNGDVMPRRGERGGRRERWQKIVREAARQSGRSHLPQLDEPAPLEQALAETGEELRLVPWEQAEVTLQSRLQERTPAGVAVLIGPEGGLTAQEVEQAAGHGFQAVSLGPRILRSETAGIAVAGILQYLFGDLGSSRRPNSDA